MYGECFGRLIPVCEQGVSLLSICKVRYLQNGYNFKKQQHFVKVLNLF